jgi:hypothetical protein
LLGESPIKAETLKIGFNGKCDVTRVKILQFFELARVLVRLDHIVSPSPALAPAGMVAEFINPPMRSGLQSHLFCPVATGKSGNPAQQARLYSCATNHAVLGRGRFL